MTMPVWNGVQFGPTGRKLQQVLDAYPGDKSGLYITSAYRPSSPTHHGGLNYGGSPTAAIDIGFGYGSSGYQARARALASWLYQFSGETVELIISRVGSSNSNGGYYVHHQSRTGAYAHTGNPSQAHENHIHFATSAALADRILDTIGNGGGGTPGDGRPGPGGPSQSEIAVTRYSARPSCRPGDEGGKVGHLQFLLRDRLGYDIDKVSGSPFGPQTEAAVKAFKEDYPTRNEKDFKNITPNVGSGTWRALERRAAQAISTKNRPMVGQNMDTSEGMWVGYLQAVLRDEGGYNIDDVDGFPFGPQTHSALADFQAEYDVPKSVKPNGDGDGIAGKETWDYIDKLELGELGGSPPPPPDDDDPPEGYDDTVEPIFGWDASDYDHSRGMRAGNIRNAEDEGIVFFTHKVTEGTSVVHQHCGTKLSAAKEAGIPFLGAYVVVRTPGNNGHGSVSAQVNFAIDEISNQFPDWEDFPGWFWQVDLEKWEYDNVAQQHGVEMCNLLEERTGKKAVLYAPRWAYGDSIGGNHPIWNSDYRGSGAPANFKTQWNRTEGDNHPGFAPMSGRTPAILQYASDATIGGQGTCDANIFRGTAQDFADMIEAPDAAPPPNPDPTDPGGEIPPRLQDMKDRVMNLADDHGLSGVQYLGIAPSDDTAYGYHNSRDRHDEGWTRDGEGDYSVQVPLDRLGFGKHFSALDLGGNNDTGREVTKMMTQRLSDAIAEEDVRIRYLREFYGTLNGDDVYGRIHDDTEEEWRESSSDDSHLWHLHISFFRRYNNDEDAMKAIGDLLLGIPVETDPPDDPPVDPVDPELQQLVSKLMDAVAALQQYVE